MKPKTYREQMGATVATILAASIALPIFLVERTIRPDREAPVTDILMQIAQDVGVITVRTVAQVGNSGMLTALGKQAGNRVDKTCLGE